MTPPNQPPTDNAAFTLRERRVLAVVLTLWLAGWIPSMVWTWRVGGGPQFYAVWIVLAPLAIGLAASSVFCLFEFYRWALHRPSLADHIAELERELGIGG